jgi:GDP-4-dehydro-6-deoxy-D-mannose reductase
MNILVTGADGFVGGWLVRALLQSGHTVTGTCRPGLPPSPVLTGEERRAAGWIELDVAVGQSVLDLPDHRLDGVVHLAAVSSGSEARTDPGRAFEVNAAGTARLAGWLGGQVEREEANPLFLLVSTAEVYGQGSGTARLESDAVVPCSPYAASKVAGEVAATEVAGRTGLRVVTARPFPHTGPHQDTRFVVPALAERVRIAKRVGAPAIRTGSLEPVRDILDVRDVAAAYLALLTGGVPGQVYNIASGSGQPLSDILDRLMRRAGHRVIAEYDSTLGRRSDIAHLVGDSGKLRASTGWRPTISLDQTLQDLLDAQAD